MTTTGIEFSDDATVIATPVPDGEITDAEAVAMAEDAAAMLRKEWERIGTLVVIGGDTAAAIVGDDALECMGTVAPGIPASMYSGVCLITKGGGIGELEIVKTVVHEIVHETDAG